MGNGNIYQYVFNLNSFISSVAYVLDFYVRIVEDAAYLNWQEDSVGQHLIPIPLLLSC